MSAPSKTTRLGRGAYQRPSADVLDALTDPGPATAAPPAPVTSGASDARGTSTPWDTADVSDTSDTPEGVPDTRDVSGSAGTGDYQGNSGTSEHSTAPGTATVAGVFGTADDSGNLVTRDALLGGRASAGTAVTANVLDDSVNQGNKGAAGTRGSSVTRRRGGKQRAVEAQSVSVDRGNSDTPGAKPTATPRDHVKVSRPLVDEMRDAVWFLSEHGRPRVQLGELLDEAISAWLKTVKAEHTRGAAFPVRGRLR